MNASRLREVVVLLLSREKQFKVQELLNDVNTHLANLAGNPQQSDLQTQYANAFNKLRSAMKQMAESFQPSQIRLLQEIGADRFFTTNFADEIASWVQENPISPAVTQGKVAKLLKQRAAFLEDIAQLQEKLKRLNIEPTTLIEGTAEIGFLIPRDLFHNHFDELIKELGVINTVLRIFSELSTGSAQPIEVRQISTTDPQFFLGLDPVTIATLGGVITWALSQWKRVEEIRKLRSETKKNQSFTPDEIKAFFDSKIDKSINEAVEGKVVELLGESPQTPGHAHQRRLELAWALKSILARIERGMTVEIRFLPPPPKPAEGDQPQPPEPKEFVTLKDVAQQLLFPAHDRSPVLEIPPPEPEKP